MSRSRGQTAAEGSWFLRLALRSSTSFSLVLTCNSWAVQKRHVFSTDAWEYMFCIVLYDFVIGLDCPLSSFRSTPRIGEKHRVAWLDKFRTFRFLEEATVIAARSSMHPCFLLQVHQRRPLRVPLWTYQSQSEALQSATAAFRFSGGHGAAPGAFTTQRQVQEAPSDTTRSHETPACGPPEASRAFGAAHSFTRHTKEFANPQKVLYWPLIWGRWAEPSGRRSGMVRLSCWALRVVGPLLRGAAEWCGFAAPSGRCRCLCCCCSSQIRSEEFVDGRMRDPNFQRVDEALASALRLIQLVRICPSRKMHWTPGHSCKGRRW